MGTTRVAVEPADDSSEVDKPRDAGGGLGCCLCLCVGLVFALHWVYLAASKPSLRREALAHVLFYYVTNVAFWVCMWVWVRVYVCVGVRVCVCA
jgi:hypothetical protein